MVLASVPSLNEDPTNYFCSSPVHPYQKSFFDLAMIRLMVKGIVNVHLYHKVMCISDDISSVSTV